MPAPTEHKTVQARILACAQEIGWTHVSREEAERRRGFEPLIARMNTDMKKLAGMHSLREWGRLKTKSLQAGLSIFFSFFCQSRSRDHPAVSPLGLLKMTTGEVTVIIVNWQALQTLPRCLDCLGAQTLQPATILLVDNSESGECGSLSGRLPNLRLISTSRNLGFAAANNLALAETKTDWVALLNPDAFPEPEWLEHLLQAAHRHPECASFGSIQLIDADDRLLDGAGDQYHFSGLMRRAAHLKPRDRFAPRQDKKIFSPCAAAALYRTAALQAVGGFDEDFFCYGEDLDLGFRLRLAGHDSLLVHKAIVRHVGSASTGDKRSAFASYHGHRNMVWVFVKNMPGVLFWLLLPFHILVNMLLIFVLALRGQGGVALRAKRDALLGLPRAWAKRSRIQSRRKASVFQMWRELEKVWW